jgi:hypothetical protein
MERQILLPYAGLTIAVYFEKITSKKHGRKKVNRHGILSTSGNTYTFEFGLVGYKTRNCNKIIRLNST